MKELEEDLNEVNAIENDEEVEMVELTEDEENDVEGGASAGSSFSTWVLSDGIPDIPGVTEQKLAIRFNNKVNIFDYERTGNMWLEYKRNKSI